MTTPTVKSSSHRFNRIPGQSQLIHPIPNTPYPPVITKQFQASFNIDDVKLEFEKEALEEIADEAIRQKTGARGLRTIVERMLMDVMFKIPDIKGKKTFTVTKKIVQGKEKNIESLIKTDGTAIESA